MKILIINSGSSSLKYQLIDMENEGVLCGVTRIEGQKTAIFVMNPEFMLGSMGTVVGDRITALFEYALKNRLPVVGFTVSGGAS